MKNATPTIFYSPAVFVAMAALILSSCDESKSNGGESKSNERTEIRLRLQWIPQSQFAGFIVAKEKGFYDEVNLDVDIRPAGPDLKPQVTVAVGTDDIGIGVSNQIIAARSNDVPLIAIAQVFQDSANRYVLKAKNGIDSLKELAGKEIGLWLGGDEVEFAAMLATEGMALDDVTVIPQEFSVSPFLQDQYILSQVTVYNELNQILSQGYTKDQLQILTPGDYGCAIVGDVIFTTEKFLENNPEAVTDFLEASIRGWRYCIENPEEALSIVLASNPELEEADQRLQLKSVLSLVTSGKAKERGIGFIDIDDYVTAERVLFESRQIDKRVTASEAFDLSAWDSVSEDVKRLR